MTQTTLLYGVGAAKAGTSWLYRMLADHPECKLRAVKEAHYWDSFDDKQRDWQLRAFARRCDQMSRMRASMTIKGNALRADSLQRQIDEITALMSVIAGDRTTDTAYLDWLGQGASDKRLMADLTPAYALLDTDRLTRMVGASPVSKVIYLVRDPMARLWSHVRMHVTRAGSDDAQVQADANALLGDIVDGKNLPNILDRGDYRGAITRLRAVVPASRLLVGFTEVMLTPTGWAQICKFLGITPTGVDAGRRVHAGVSATMNAGLAKRAVALLKDQYEWVAEHVGPLPTAWQTNLARAVA